MSTVEVFRTTVDCPYAATLLTIALRQRFPAWRISFDLEDCDNILRVAGDGIGGSEIRQITTLLDRQGYACILLD